MSESAAKAWSAFWGNSWTRTILPLVAVGAISWTAFSGKMTSLGEQFKRYTVKNDRTLDALKNDQKKLKEDQTKDNAFRESGERFSRTDALEMELALRKEFRTV